jgi:hypothetical protein
MTEIPQRAPAHLSIGSAPIPLLTLPVFVEMNTDAFERLAKDADRLRGQLAAEAPALEPPSATIQLLRRAAAIHQAPPSWAPAELAALSGDEIIESNKTIAGRLGKVLAFVPRAVQLKLAHTLEFDPGAIALASETAFVLHVVERGLPDAERLVDHFALLVELWQALRAEELRRLRANDLLVTLAVIVGDGPDADQALDRLNKRYLSGKVRRSFLAAVASQPTLTTTEVDPRTQRAWPASWDEVTAERNVAISAALAPFREMEFSEFYAHLLDADPRLQHLPASVQRDGLNLLEQVRAVRRTLPEGHSLVSLEESVDEESGARPLGEMIPGLPGSGAATPSERDEAASPQAVVHRAMRGPRIAKALDLIRHHLGDQDAAIVGALLQLGTTVDVAGAPDLSERTVRRALRRIREHPVLRRVLPDLFA